MAAQQIDIRIIGLTPEDHRNIGAKAIVATEPMIDEIVEKLTALGITVTQHTCAVVTPRKPKAETPAPAPAAAAPPAESPPHPAGRVHAGSALDAAAD